MRATFICCWPPHPWLRSLGTASRVSFGSHSFLFSSTRSARKSHCASAELGPTQARLSAHPFPLETGGLRGRPGTRPEPVRMAECRDSGGGADRSLSPALAVAVAKVRSARAAWLPRVRARGCRKGALPPRRRNGGSKKTWPLVTLSTGSSHARGCPTTRLFSGINQ